MKSAKERATELLKEHVANYTLNQCFVQMKSEGYTQPSTIAQGFTEARIELGFMVPHKVEPDSDEELTAQELADASKRKARLEELGGTFDPENRYWSMPDGTIYDEHGNQL